MAWPRPPYATAVLLTLCLAPASPAPSSAQAVIEAIPFDHKLLASTGAAPDRFGAPLAISGDVLVAAAPRMTVDGKLLAGGAFVFIRDGLGTWVESKRLVAADGAAFDQLGGSSVAVAGDTAFLGASRAEIGDVLQQGAVYVFDRNAGGPDNWGQTAKLTDDSVGSIGNFGDSIAVDGDVLVVGASRGAGGNGQVTIFERDRGGPGAWGKVTDIADIAVADGGLPLESFGSAVALDGDLLLVGASTADVSFFREDDGAAYLFRRNAGDQWNFVTRLTEPGATACPGALTLADASLESEEVRAAVEACALGQGTTDRNGFGRTVALEGDTIVIGAAGAEAASGPVVGAAYVFRQDPADADHWDQVAHLSGSDILESSSPGFGASLALAGDTILVGASGAEVGSRTNQGAAYLFRRDAGGADVWGEVSKLVAGDGLVSENFGSAVALDGGNGIVGASGYESGQGTVYLAGESTAAPPPEPAFTPTAELANGGIVEAANGALLGAIGDALVAPLPVWILELPPPEEPVLAPMVALGSFYSIGAVTTTSAQGEEAFGLALPVPAGADTAHLAIAVLNPPTRLIEGGGTTSTWVPLRGTYNPEADLFSIALPTLHIEGRSVVLIEDPDILPVEPAGLPAPSLTDPELLPDFNISCRAFTDTTQCQPSDQARMNGLLKAAHDDFISLGFGKPKLWFTSSAVAVTERGKTFEKVVSASYGSIFATEPSKCPANTLGLYDHQNGGSLTICYSGSSTPEANLSATIRHEIFHAFQSGFANFDTALSIPVTAQVGTALEDLMWILEGTAAASEESEATMHRNKVDVPPLHPITRALTAAPANDLDLIHYSAQDFWVFVGNTFGPPPSGLSYLTEVFLRGGSPDAADGMLALHGTSLADAYFRWAKNQAVEKTDPLDGALVAPCSLVVTRDAPIVGTPREMSFPARDTPPLASGTLERLTAKIVRITVVAAATTPTTVTATSSDPSLAFKVFVDGDPACADGDDGTRRFETLAKDTVLLVLVANTSHQPGRRIDYTVSVAPAP